MGCPLSWSGDISKMGQLAANVAKLAAVPARASKRVAKEIEALIEEEFDHECDPYGNAWKPLADSTVEKKGFTTVLEDSRAMRDSLSVTPRRGAGVSITIDHPSEDHQTGWSGSQGAGPARPILPGGRMPARWNQAIKLAVRDEFKRSA